MYKIDKDIKFEDARGSRIYPFSDMEVGDSFFVKTNNKEESRSKRQSVYGTARFYAKGKDIKFSTKIYEDGVRIWRVK